MRPLAGAISVLVLCAVIVCVASSETHDPPNGNMSLDCRIQPEDQHSKVPDAHALLQMPQLASSRQTTSALDDVVHVQPRDDLAPVIMLQQHKPFRPHFCRPLSERIPELKLWHLFVGTIAMVVFVFKALMQPMKAPRPTDSWTGIRALVAQWVVVEHLGIFIPPCGGGLFVVLSGALLALEATSLQSVGQYFTWFGRRAFRILPAFWVYWILALVFLEGEPIMQNLSTMTIDQWFLLDTLMLGHRRSNFLWFLSTVMCLYAMFPFVNSFLLWLGIRQSVGRGLGCAAACYGAQLALFACVIYGRTNAMMLHEPWQLNRPLFNTSIDIYTHPVCRLPQFALGMATAHIWKTATTTSQAEEITDTKKENRQQLLSLVFAVCADLAFLLFFIWAACAGLGLHFTSYKGYANMVYRTNLAAPIFALLLFGMAYSPNKCIAARVLSSRWLMEAGKVSYGIYLWGWVVMMKFDLQFSCNKQHSSPLRWMTFFSWLLMAGMLSFHLVEDPCLKFSKRLL